MFESMQNFPLELRICWTKITQSKPVEQIKLLSS